MWGNYLQDRPAVAEVAVVKLPTSRVVRMEGTLTFLSMAPLAVALHAKRLSAFGVLFFFFYSQLQYSIMHCDVMALLRQG